MDDILVFSTGIQEIFRAYIKPNLEKIKKILFIKLPQNQKPIKRFLGIFGYYRKFIIDYAKIAQPLTKFKKTSKINSFHPTYINAFETVKQLIITHPMWIRTINLSSTQVDLLTITKSITKQERKNCKR